MVDRSAPMLLVKLRVKGQKDFRVVTDQVLHFKYIDRERKADLAKLTIDNSDLSHFDDPVWRKGSQLHVRWGYPGRMAPERLVVVQSVTGFKRLTVEAVAKSMLMNRKPRSRSFDGLTISQVAERIAAENGFSGEFAHIDRTSEVYEVVTQANLTDAQFLRRWASRLGYEFYVDYDGLHFHERRLGARPLRRITYHGDGSGDIIGDPVVENDITAKPGRTRVRGRDSDKKEDFDVSADNDSDTGRTTLAETQEVLSFDQTGTKLMKGQRALDPNDAASSEKTLLTADADAEAARRRAAAKFRRDQQVAVKLKFEMIGDPLLLAKSVNKLEGLGKRLSILYYLESVEHDLGENGYICKVSAVSDGHGGHSTVSTHALGLGAFNVAGAGKSGATKRGVSDEVLASLREVHDATSAAGESDSTDAVEKAIKLYLRKGNAVNAGLIDLLADVARGTAVKNVVDAVVKAQSLLQQQGDERKSRGKPNRQEPEEDTDRLAERALGFDESGRELVGYEQSPRKK